MNTSGEEKLNQALFEAYERIDALELEIERLTVQEKEMKLYISEANKALTGANTKLERYRAMVVNMAWMLEER